MYIRLTYLLATLKELALGKAKTSRAPGLIAGDIGDNQKDSLFGPGDNRLLLELLALLKPNIVGVDLEEILLSIDVFETAGYKLEEWMVLWLI